MALLMTCPADHLQPGDWAVVDWGLVRRFRDEAGRLLPARPEAAFRGSTTYASVHAHTHHDQGRRDDLWSWLYVVVELLEGTLPWRAIPRVEGLREQDERFREAVVAAKQQCMAEPARLVPSIPQAGEAPLRSTLTYSILF